MRVSYQRDSLDEARAADRPLAQFAAWLDEAVAAGVTEPNAMTLATVGPVGRPSTRNVLMKGFDAHGVVFYTMPDIVVNQPQVAPGQEGTEAKAAENANKDQHESDLRGILSNDSMTDDEKKQLEEDRARTEESAKLRDEDYQLAYAVDILRGLAAVAPKK